MKFKLIRADVTDSNCYNKTNVSTGDIIDLRGHFAKKASKNPAFEKVQVKRKPKK